jgi:hypothetical protein
MREGKESKKKKAGWLAWHIYERRKGKEFVFDLPLQSENFHFKLFDE